MTILAIHDVPILVTKEHTWTLKEGVFPTIESFNISPAGHRRLENIAPGPVDLRMDDKYFRDLFILDFPEGPNPFVHSVRLADRRFWWPYAHVTRRFNIRRRIGVKRIRQMHLPDVLQPVTEDLFFKRFSLHNPDLGFAGRWKPLAAILDVFSEVLRTEKERFGTSVRILASKEFETIPIENLEIDDPGESAIARLLNYFPDARVMIDAMGNVKIYGRADGRDTEMVQRTGAELINAGHVEIVKESRIRPREIHVLFTREIELRMDYRSSGVGPAVDQGSTADHVAPRAQAGKGILLENVLPLPDFELTVADIQHVTGEWVVINDDLMTAWGNPPGALQLTDIRIRRGMIPGVQLWNRLNRFGVFDPKANWPARLSALQQHWRRTYRVHEKVMDRIVSLKAYRVGTVNRATAQRAPPAAFGDWTAWPTVKYIYDGNHENTSLMLPNSSFENKTFDITFRTRGMPAAVSVVDEDQGIIQLDFRIDPWGREIAILPGLLENIPSGDVAAAKRKNLAVNAVGTGEAMQFDADYLMSVIMTVQPGAPNSDEQLHRIIVKPENVMQLLPTAARFNPSDALGPSMEVRVGPGVETARFAWSDANAEALLSAGLGFRQRDVPAPDISALIVNADQQGPIWEARLGASINAIAQAEAARIWATFADRYHGNMSGGNIRLDVEPAGALAEVTFTVSTKGVLSTDLKLPGSLEPIDFLAFVNDSTRAILTRVVMPG